MRSSVPGLQTKTKRQGCLFEHDGARLAAAASSRMTASLTSTGARERSDRRCFRTALNSMAYSLTQVLGDGTIPAESQMVLFGSSRPP